MGQAVTIQTVEEGVIQITMQDREYRNTFSKNLIKGIMDAFDHIRSSVKYKVVILTGYESYFCCGGTKDELIDIYEGRMGFNDLNFFSLPLLCEIPVISAMQGHAVGGGFVFGLYSDFSILGKENIYTANFMKYGFTPGMGGTFIIPKRLGELLGNEMLYTAENYRGGDLKERGVPLKVVSKTEVLHEAITLARSLAEKPRLSLVTLKNHLTAEARTKLPSVIEEELRMHGITFRQPEVAERIEKLFGR